MAAAIGVSTPVVHALELFPGVVTEVRVQLPLPREIRPAWRAGLRRKANAGCSAGRDDDGAAHQHREGRALLGHVCAPAIPAYLRRHSQTPTACPTKTAMTLRPVPRDGARVTV